MVLLIHVPAFVPLLPLQKRDALPARCPTRTRPRPVRAGVRAELESVPSTPGRLLRSWADSRTISSTADLSRRFISVLFLSNHCQRAAYAEKQLAKLAAEYSISRRLLILSAGVYSNPGDLLPWKLVRAAQQRGVDMSDERPCASFDVSDRKLLSFVSYLPTQLVGNLVLTNFLNLLFIAILRNACTYRNAVLHSLQPVNLLIQSTTTTLW